MTADWTFLNQPELLTDLNNRYVHLVQLSPKQVVTSLDSIPPRPAPAPVSLDGAPEIAEALDVPAPPPLAPAPMPPAAAPPAAPARTAIVPVSAVAPARAPIVSAPIVTAAAIAPSHAAKAASLDGLFAQVTGGH